MTYRTALLPFHALGGLGLAVAAARAQEAAPPRAPDLPRVEIRAERGSLDERRRATAAKTIVGRDELQRHGDDNVGDALKRLPGVTVDGAGGRGGEVRMRGMGGGYTQILINGERMPPGFALETLSPEQIERVEVLRAPSAEFGAQAIAGTINIVLREDVRRRVNTLRAGLGLSAGRGQPSLSWEHADADGAFSHSLTASLTRQSVLDESRTLTTTTDAGVTRLKDETDRGRTHRERLNLGGRAQWRLGPAETFALSPYLLYSGARIQGGSRVAAPVPPDSPAATERRDRTAFALARTSAQWQAPLGSDGSLDVKVNVYLSQWTGAPVRLESGSAPRRIEGESRASDNGVETTGKLTHALAGGHQLAAGWNLEQGVRRERQHTAYLRLPAAAATSVIDDDYRGTRRVAALWLQDEWQPLPQWTAQAGLRWELIDWRSRWIDAELGAPRSARNRNAVLSPLLHAVWRLDPDSKDLVRASLTRAFKAPSSWQVSPRRQIAQSYPTTGPNTPTASDRIGNPALQPELSTGLDLAYEHYLPGSGVVSVGVFHRRIRHLIRTVTSAQPQAVPWSPVPRYVSQPVNVGSARTSGLELEAKLRLADLHAGLPRTDVRANLSLFHSRVADVPGPDNRLDRQPGHTANLGADHRWAGTPWAAGASLNLTPGYAVQQSASQRLAFTPKRVLDAYATWTARPGLQLRLAASNLFPQALSTTSSYASAGPPAYDETAQTFTTSMTQWTLRLELRL